MHTGLRLSSFQYYLSGLGSSAVAMGLQVVIFPWLVVGVLHESADRVGLAQMAVMLPNLLLILLGGALSDNRHLGSHLFRLYLLYLLPFGLMFIAVNNDLLSYQLLIIFGASYGVITAFIQPARESLLSQVGGEDLQGSVVRTTLVQFGAQSLGYLSAGLFDSIGLSILLVFQMVMFVAAGLFLRASNPVGEGQSKGRQRQSQSIVAGLKAVWHHARLRALMLLVGATGFLGFGVYLVAMPLMTREVYGQSAVFYAGLQLSFTAGVLLANVLYLRLRGGFRQPGRVLVISLFCRGLIMLLIATHLPIALLFPAVLVWGMFSGISISLGRMMTHTEAPEAYRSRVVSIYQLAFFGTAPIGAWMTGQLISTHGVLATFAGLGTLTLLVGSLGVFSQLWRSPAGKPAGQP
ncbi:MAG: MFS transporter [Gammaproteobacteria bacterium]|nr:MFS transporter [Gammaproteobacteria bacterium]MBQ0840410.1 MFS transporter [Gammaproteobacteria bacterium]